MLPKRAKLICMGVLYHVFAYMNAGCYKG